MLSYLYWNIKFKFHCHIHMTSSVCGYNRH